MAAPDPRPCIVSPVTGKRICDGADPRPADLSGIDNAYRHAVERSANVCPDCVATLPVAFGC